MAMDALEAQFNEAMMNIYRRAKSECNYQATYFLQMVQEEGGIATARSLLAKKQVSDGFTALWDCGCLHITVECLVLHPDFCKLFDDSELEIARTRLREGKFDYTKCEKQTKI